MVMDIAHRSARLTLWEPVLETVRFAFQPIVNTFSGRVTGYEALLRGWDEAGFASIAAFFQSAVDDELVLEIHTALLKRAITSFLATPAGRAPDDIESPSIRLYFNVDNRTFLESSAGAVLLETVVQSELPADRLTLEISELNRLPEAAHHDHHLPLLRNEGVQIALDDFGSGYSDLQLLYHAGSDIIKIDRFFISQIERDSTKRVFVTNLVGMAHAFGIYVVAEGIETAEEYYTCREIGCDSIQGFLIAHPTTDCNHLRRRYSVIDNLIALDRRRRTITGQVLKQRIRQISPIVQGTPILEVLQRFRTDREITFLPMVNRHNEPIGILREHDLKEYVYSPYGIALLSNRAYGHEPYTYIRKVPVVPAHSGIDRLLELAAIDNAAEALIITENGQYIGCLDSHALLQILHERELASARDQNPLTRLPGNTVIAERLAKVSNPAPYATVVTYFDFDTFKPFNDHYGFRIGDRVIQLFADLLRITGIADRDFAGHVGGDD
ncbi:MAG: GGDEF domain-containing protein, partial [Spirochaeta sp.]|nr:GGDEF domain-containing protein [Spirochaeta sp.]